MYNSDNIYLFCIEYRHNHIENKEPISKYVSHYYYDLSLRYETYEYKRLYNENKDWAFKLEEENIKYCEDRLKINEKVLKLLYIYDMNTGDKVENFLKDKKNNKIQNAYS